MKPKSKLWKWGLAVLGVLVAAIATIPHLVATDFYTTHLKGRLFPSESNLKVKGFVKRYEDIPRDAYVDRSKYYTPYTNQTHLHFEIVNRGAPASVEAVVMIYYFSDEAFTSNGKHGDRAVFAIWKGPGDSNSGIVPAMPEMLETGRLYRFDCGLDDRFTGVRHVRLLVHDSLADKPVKLVLDDPWKHMRMITVRRNNAE